MTSLVEDPPACEFEATVESVEGTRGALDGSYFYPGGGLDAESAAVVAFPRESA